MHTVGALCILWVRVKAWSVHGLPYWKKVQVGIDQEKVQSEKDSHSKIRVGKRTNQQSGSDTKKTFCKLNEQLFFQLVATQLP